MSYKGGSKVRSSSRVSSKRSPKLKGRALDDEDEQPKQIMKKIEVKAMQGLEEKAHFKHTLQQALQICMAELIELLHDTDVAIYSHAASLLIKFYTEQRAVLSNITFIRVLASLCASMDRNLAALAMQTLSSHSAKWGERLILDSGMVDRVAMLMSRELKRNNMDIAVIEATLNVIKLLCEYCCSKRRAATNAAAVGGATKGKDTVSDSTASTAFAIHATTMTRKTNQTVKTETTPLKQPNFYNDAL
jgi:hypothetical protein